MSRLTDLIAQVKAKDSALGVDLEAEFKVLSERRVFGLNFERHRPEAVELPQWPVRKGDKVRILPPRGSIKRGDQRLWRVQRTEAAATGRIAHLALLDGDETQTAAMDDLVVVAEFRDPHRHQDKQNPPLYKARLERRRRLWAMTGSPVSTYGRPKQRNGGWSNAPMPRAYAANGAGNACTTLEKSLS